MVNMRKLAAVVCVLAIWTASASKSALAQISCSSCVLSLGEVKPSPWGPYTQSFKFENRCNHSIDLHLRNGHSESLDAGGRRTIACSKPNSDSRASCGVSISSVQCGQSHSHEKRFPNSRRSASPRDDIKKEFDRLRSDYKATQPKAGLSWQLSQVDCLEEQKRCLRSGGGYDSCLEQTKSCLFRSDRKFGVRVPSLPRSSSSYSRQGRSSDCSDPCVVCATGYRFPNCGGR